ncbi:MAG: glycosyltransferase [Methanobacterium sp. Maddingley MBC34]|nr:MAG: glycosyltransferase [Methanobacterium sp. Maddingley MBC34]
MKIITISLSNSDDLRGGAYRRYMELINAFIDMGDEVHHISPRGFSNIFAENLHHYGTHIIRIPPTYLPFSLQAIPMAISIARKNKIDVFVSFTIFDALIGIISKIFYSNMKVLLCDRADSITGMKIQLEKKHRTLSRPIHLILSKLENWIYRNVDFTIFNSKIRRNDMINKSKINPDDTCVVYNNANPSWVVLKEEEAVSDSIILKNRYKNKKIISFVGNLYLDGRDIITLLYAFKIIKKEIPESLLFIVGDGPDKINVINFVKINKLEDSVFVEGWRNNPFVYMVASDLNIVTALHEGFSNTILESLYLNKLVLGSDVGGIPEQLKYEELLFHPKNHEELALKAIKLLKNAYDHEIAVEMIKERRSIFIFNWNKKMLVAINKVVDQ